MPTAYDELYAWMHVVFGESPFNIPQFRETFPSPAPKKVLSDLRKLNYVEKLSRGTYRVIAPAKRVESMIRREGELVGIPEMAGLPYAYCDETAVTIWTDGEYWTGFTPGFRPLHMRIPMSSLESWRKYFRKMGVRAVVEGSRETLFGLVYVLHPRARVRSVRRGQVHVVPAAEVLAFAEERPYLYEPILPALRKKVARSGQ